MITDHPDYEALRKYKNDNAMQLMGEFGAHSVGIRWKGDTDSQVSDDRDIALAVYLSPERAKESTVPKFIEIEKDDGTGSLKIAVEVVVSEQPSFEN